MDKSHVSMEQHRCLICGVDYDTGALLLDKRLRQSLERTTVTGMGLCPEHQEKYDEGFIALVGIDPEKSTQRGDTVKFEDAYRTSMVGHLHMSAWEDAFNTPIPVDKEGKTLPFIFIDQLVLEQFAGAQA